MVHASEFKHDCARDEGANNCESCMPDQNRLMMHGSFFSWTFVQDLIYSLGNRQLDLLSVVPVSAWALLAMDIKSPREGTASAYKRRARSYYAE